MLWGISPSIGCESNNNNNNQRTTRTVPTCIIATFKLQALHFLKL